MAWRRVRNRWTRQAHVIHDWDTALDARVALAAPEYRAAYVRMVSGMRSYSETKRAELVAQQQFDTEHYVEIWVAMQTSRWEWNDLTSNRSVWTLTFHDDAGHSIEPIERAQLGEKAADVSQLFEDTTPFTIAWRVRFPLHFADGTPLLTPETHRVSVRFAGPLGTSTVSWDAKR